jgi:hypothetical protein
VSIATVFPSCQQILTKPLVTRRPTEFATPFTVRATVASAISEKVRSCLSGTKLSNEVNTIHVQMSPLFLPKESIREVSEFVFPTANRRTERRTNLVDTQRIVSKPGTLIFETGFRRRTCFNHFSMLSSAEIRRLKPTSLWSLLREWATLKLSAISENLRIIEILEEVIRIHGDLPATKDPSAYWYPSTRRHIASFPPSTTKDGVRITREHSPTGSPSILCLKSRTPREFR